MVPSMSLPSELALAHQRRRTSTTDRATVAALRLWRQINPQELDIGWTVQAPQMVAAVTAAQVVAAGQATPYLNSVDRFYGRTSDVQLVPEAFGGVTLDGREIGPAMFGAVTTTKTLTSRVGAARAFEVGASFLATIIGAAVQDMGRQADMALATGKGYTRYVRVVSAGACSRCAILAGKGDYREPFKRHPRCKCTSAPIPDGQGAPAGFYDTPTQYFESLSEAEQDRVFTKSGAWAIREGADPVSVVNARRGYFGSAPKGVAPRRLQPTTIGMKADGTPLRVFTTAEGTTARGAFAKAEARQGAEWTKSVTDRYRRTTSIRLMPEQIQVMGAGNPERTRELLKRYGYLA